MGVKVKDEVKTKGKVVVRSVTVKERWVGGKREFG